MIRRRALAALAVLSLGVAGCGVPGSGERVDGEVDLSQKKPTDATLTVLTKYADPQYAPYFESMARAYEKKNPGITVELSQVGDQPYKDKIRVLAASKTMPDVYFSWAGDFAHKFVRGGYSADLTSVAGPDTDWGSTFAPGALKAFTVDGRVQGIPLNLDGKYMAYNPSLLAEAGVSAPPKTFEQLLGACRALRKQGVTPIAFGNQFGWPGVHYLTQLNAYNVAPKTLERDADPETGSFTDDGYVQALKQFQTLVRTCSTKGANGISHDSAQSDFLRGKAGMTYIETVEFPTVREGAEGELATKWKSFPLPAPTRAAGDPHSVAGAPDGFMVNRRSEHPTLAVDFLKFVTSRSNAARMTEDLGWVSPVKKSMDPDKTFPQLRDNERDLNSTQRFAVWLDTATTASVGNAYLAGIEGIVDGSQTPQQVIAAVRHAAAAARKPTG